MPRRAQVHTVVYSCPRWCRDRGIDFCSRSSARSEIRLLNFTLSCIPALEYWFWRSFYRQNQRLRELYYRAFRARDTKGPMRIQKWPQLVTIKAKCDENWSKSTLSIEPHRLERVPRPKNTNNNQNWRISPRVRGGSGGEAPQWTTRQIEVV